MAIISHLNDIFTKGGEKGIKVGKISKEEVRYYQKVTWCGKIVFKCIISSKGKADEKQILH